MIKILVVEDSEKDLLLYKNVLEKIEGIQVCYALSGEGALEILKDNHVDIFILDIELPGISGLELAGKIRNLPDYALTLIMFITGYEKNQLEAFKQFHCYDYIIKPFSSRDFHKKIAMLIKNISVEKQKRFRIRMLLYPDINKEILVPIDQIVYAEISNRHCYLYTELQEEPFKSSIIVLKELVNDVNDPYFIQCHKSYAVNIKKIKQVERQNYRLWTITLQNSEHKLYISSKYYELIDEKLKIWINEKEGIAK
nr:LytTR family DNA-binding domain-containing protein [uncultured Aminipila sp.]